MKPVYQTKLQHPDGNCVPACLASILEVDLEDVPEIEWWKPVSHCYQKIDEWLGNYNLKRITIKSGSDFVTKSNAPYIKTIVNVSSDSTVSAHAVVACKGEIIHDPHPSQPSKLMKRGREYDMILLQLQILHGR